MGSEPIFFSKFLKLQAKISIFWSTLIKFEVFSAQKFYSNRKKKEKVVSCVSLGSQMSPFHRRQLTDPGKGKVGLNLTRESIPEITGSAGFYFLDKFCKHHFASAPQVLDVCSSVIRSFHMLLNLRTLIRCNFIQFLTNFSVDFSLCMSELKKDLKN